MDRTGIGSDEGPILVVDDDPQVRQLIRWALEDEGMPVELAADGGEAIDCATRRKPALVILDLGLPTVPGNEVANAIRVAHGEGLRILTITADGSAAEKARLVGAYAYLRKPFGIDELLTSVRSGLGAPS
jgi:two-component system KDP operon response regulator KdpE